MYLLFVAAHESVKDRIHCEISPTQLGRGYMVDEIVAEEDTPAAEWVLYFWQLLPDKMDETQLAEVARLAHDKAEKNDPTVGWAELSCAWINKMRADFDVRDVELLSQLTLEGRAKALVVCTVTHKNSTN